MPYELHPSERLNAYFREKPWQGEPRDPRGQIFILDKDASPGSVQRLDCDGRNSRIRVWPHDWNNSSHLQSLLSDYSF